MSSTRKCGHARLITTQGSVNNHSSASGIMLCIFPSLLFWGFAILGTKKRKGPAINRVCWGVMYGRHYSVLVSSPG